MTIREAEQDMVSRLKRLYDDREAANIADWAMEHITGRKRTGRLLVKNDVMPDDWLAEYQRVTSELATHKPVQYVLHEAWFAGMKFYVDEHVLIPRPETEELVDWVTAQHTNTDALSVIDIGTGSGCIPIALKKKRPGWEITAADVSEEALEVAAKNGAALGAPIEWRALDFLDKNKREELGLYNVIVSNPPYIRRSEESGMSANVLSFEPHTALFVPDADPLLFYRAIADFAERHLLPGGCIYLEINEALGAETAALFAGKGYTVTGRKDLQGKDRMLQTRRIN